MSATNHGITRDPPLRRRRVARPPSAPGRQRGILPEEKDFIPSEIFRQARVAFEEAAAIVMVIDGRHRNTRPDMELVRLLRKTGRPLFLAVNKLIQTGNHR